MNSELEGIGKDAVVPVDMQYHLGISLAGLRKDTQNLRNDGLCRARDWYQEPPQNMSGELPLCQPARSSNCLSSSDTKGRGWVDVSEPLHGTTETVRIACTNTAPCSCTAKS
jgi:hypothetical protein